MDIDIKAEAKKKVYLIGVYHDLQYGHDRHSSPVDTGVYEEAVRKAIKYKKIKSVAEEMNLAKLRKIRGDDNEDDTTVTLRVAKELSNKCYYYDLPENADDGSKYNDEDREKEWLRRILETNEFPALFILGSEHIITFGCKLKKAKLIPGILETFTDYSGDKAFID